MIVTAFLKTLRASNAVTVTAIFKAVSATAMLTAYGLLKETMIVKGFTSKCDCNCEHC